ncbi:MAG: ABC transporter ATP-binding protein [Oscillospiraceae bacterium]|nr:ABC transporter ATP-binding protein [Oscillospiraceae bacterium]
MMALLQCNQLTKYYDSALALDHVDLAVEPGRIVGLLGPNGSGKTTLIKIANGLLVPSSGTLTIDGMAPGPDTKQLVSYLPERTYLSDWMNVVQLLDFFCDFYLDFDRSAAEHMLTALDISPRLRIKQMSKGTREKVQLILVMSRKARLYLLDEPIGGVDPATRDYIIRTILTNYNEQASVVISTHLIADVENILDDVIFINRGRVVLQSSVDHIREEKNCSVDELFREVFRYAE